MAHDPTKVRFGHAVHGILRRRGMTLEEAGKIAKVEPSLISKWKRGDWQVIPEETLERVIKAVAQDEDDLTALAAAYAYDMVPGSVKGRVTVTKTKRGSDADMRGLVGQWNVETRQKLQEIGDAVQYDEDIRQLFNSLAAIAKRANGKR